MKRNFSVLATAELARRVETQIVSQGLALPAHAERASVVGIISKMSSNFIQHIPQNKEQKVYRFGTILLRE